MKEENKPQKKSNRARKCRSFTSCGTYQQRQKQKRPSHSLPPHHHLLLLFKTHEPRGGDRRETLDEIKWLNSTEGGGHRETNRYTFSLSSSSSSSQTKCTYRRNRTPPQGGQTSRPSSPLSQPVSLSLSPRTVPSSTTKHHLLLFFVPFFLLLDANESTTARVVRLVCASCDHVDVNVACCCCCCRSLSSSGRSGELSRRLV